MNNKIMTIKNVRAYQDKKGTAYLNLEDVARGLGFTQTKNEIEYIRWETIKSYLKEFSFPTSWENEKGSRYIPENIFYKLCFKAKNETARKFQDLVTDEILPAIRKTGGYIAGEEDMTEDELVLKAINVLSAKVENLKQKNALLEADNNQKDQLIGELKPKADYTDKILQSKGTVKINVIANDYGLTAIAMNKKLHELKIQYRQGKDWLLYGEHRGKGYTHSKTIHFFHKDGRPDTRMNMEWTQKGRLFLYEILKKNGIIPMIEQ